MYLVKITAIVLCDFINHLAPFCDFKTNNGLRKRYKIPNIWFLPNANSYLSCPSIQKCSILGKVLTPINKTYLHFLVNASFGSGKKIALTKFSVNQVK